MSRRSHRTRRAGAALAAWAALACGDAVAPETWLCAEILALQVPGAELLETWPGEGGAALDYRVADEEGGGVHRIECLIAAPEQGPAGPEPELLSSSTAEGGGAERRGGLPSEAHGLRPRSIRIDGREFSEAGLVLVNSELLLAEIRRADPGPPRSPAWEATRMMLHAGAGWMEATLSRLAREALSTLDAWWDRAWEGAQERGGVEAQV